MILFEGANVGLYFNIHKLFSYFLLFLSVVLIKSSIFAAFLINVLYENSFNRLRKDG